jgi:DNA-3-methyladenine glycosylase
MLRPSFFARAPLICARELIGAELRWGPCRGRIVETEAYAAVGDEAAHTFVRPSTREFLTRNPPGTAYVYLNYGMHWLFNVLVKGGGGADDGFVLIRALEPTHGLAQMRRRRGLDAASKLCSGPGKLTQALGIDGGVHGRDLCATPTHSMSNSRQPTPEVLMDLRVGITRSAQLPWRFLAAESSFVSVRPSAHARKV